MHKVAYFHSTDPSRRASAWVFLVSQTHSRVWMPIKSNSCSVPLFPASKAVFLAKAVYYSQIPNANLEFSCLTGGKAIRWEFSRVSQRTRNQSWHLKSLGAFSVFSTSTHFAGHILNVLRKGSYSNLRQTIAMTTTAMMKTKLAVMDPMMRGNCSCHDFGGSALGVKERKI